MKTSELVVEVLIAGILSCLSILLVLHAIVDLDTPELELVKATLKDYSLITLPIVLALLYQFGSLVNFYSYYLGKNILGGSSITADEMEKNAIDSEHKYVDIRDYVYQKANDAAIQKIREKLVGIRVSRNGVAFFTLIFVGFLLHSWYILAFINFAIILLNLIQFRKAHRDYVGRILRTYKILVKGMANESIQPITDAPAD